MILLIGFVYKFVFWEFYASSYPFAFNLDSCQAVSHLAETF